MASSMRSRETILAVASGGGHWLQLLRLRDAWASQRVVYASVRAELRSDVTPDAFVRLPDATRWNKTELVRCMLHTLRLVLTIRPRAVITTGAAPGLFALAFGKLVGARTIWVDSIANASELSMSGRLARWTADVWLTQWEHIARPNGPEYHGSVL
jgi:hypothetical protein